MKIPQFCTPPEGDRSRIVCFTLDLPVPVSLTNSSQNFAYDRQGEVVTQLCFQVPLLFTKKQLITFLRVDIRILPQDAKLGHRILDAVFRRLFWSARFEWGTGLYPQRLWRVHLP